MTVAGSSSHHWFVIVSDRHRRRSPPPARAPCSVPSDLSSSRSHVVVVQLGGEVVAMSGHGSASGAALRSAPVPGVGFEPTLHVRGRGSRTAPTRPAGAPPSVSCSLIWTLRPVPSVQCAYVVRRVVRSVHTVHTTGHLTESRKAVDGNVRRPSSCCAVGRTTMCLRRPLIRLRRSCPVRRRRWDRLRWVPLRQLAEPSSSQLNASSRARAVSASMRVQFCPNVSAMTVGSAPYSSTRFSSLYPNSKPPGLGARYSSVGRGRTGAQP